jgi:hypothetical protein
MSLTNGNHLIHNHQVKRRRGGDWGGVRNFIFILQVIQQALHTWQVHRTTKHHLMRYLEAFRII